MLFPPNRLSQKIARAGRGVGVLRAAIVLRERRQNRAALIFALGAAEAAAAQPLEAGRDLIEIRPHLLDLVIDRTALRRLAVEQREKSGTVAAHALGLRGYAIEFGLLLGGGILVAADLVVPGGIAGTAAAIDGRQLRLQPGHIGLTGAPCGGGGIRIRLRLRVRIGAQRDGCRAARRRPGSIGVKGNQVFRAYPAIRAISRRPGSRQARPTRLPHSRFSGQRHVVSGAPMWQQVPPISVCTAASALAGNGDVFVAAGVTAVAAGRLGNRPRDFIRIDAPIGRGLGEIARLAIGPRGMGAAFVALGQALVDAVTVGLVLDDENAAVGRCRRARRARRSRRPRSAGKESHAAPVNERTPLIR